MMELAKKPEVSESKLPTVENYKDIKPQEGMTPKEARAFWDGIFKNSELPSAEMPEGKIEPVDGHYVPYKDRLDRTPKVGSGLGSWEGSRGESKFIPSNETEAGRAAIEKLSEKGMDGIMFKDAEPNFSECAEITVQIDNMTESRGRNFYQADSKCAEQWNATAKEGRTDWTVVEVRDWRRENNYSWHERCDTRTMDLVSYDIHSYFLHSGGVAECMARDRKNSGGGFDE